MLRLAAMVFLLAAAIYAGSALQGRVYWVAAVSAFAALAVPGVLLALADLVDGVRAVRDELYTNALMPPHQASQGAPARTNQGE